MSGCAGSHPTSGPVSRELPVEPAFAREVHVTHKEGDDLLVIAGRERAGRQRANDVIVCFVEWYRDVRHTYGPEIANAKASEINKRCAAGDRDAFIRKSPP